MLQCPEDRLKHRSLKTQKSLLSALLASSMTFWTSSIWVIMVQRLKAQYREVRPWLEKKKKTINWIQAAEIMFTRSNAKTLNMNKRYSTVSPILPLNPVRKVICLKKNKKQTLKYCSCCFELDSLHG